MQRSIGFILFGLLFLTVLFPATEETEEYIPEKDPLVQKKIGQWQNLKFGLLMHWGPYSQWGVVESWSICSEDEEWCRRNLNNYTEYKRRYEELYKTFNPVKFDPDGWAKAAKDAGMKYVIFTTKHHDGFCMFDTKQTDYRITSPDCPFSKNPRADVTGEIFNAFRKEGFWVGAYFSKPDWHSEYYWWPNFATPDRHVNYDIGKHPECWEKFIHYTHNQVDELMSRYGRIDILWLDGGWVKPEPNPEIKELPLLPGYSILHLQNQDIRMEELVRLSRKSQPGLIVVDRAVKGPHQDYLTPESRVPEKMIPYPWESCISMGGGWSYTPGAVMKPARELVHLLVDIVSKGGNLLLNIGPGPDGTWYPEAYDRLREMGEWLRINGEAIYATRPIAPYRSSKVCLTRGKNGAVYALYLADDNESMPERITVPFAPSRAAKLRMLGSRLGLSWVKEGKGIRVMIPKTLQKRPPCSYAWTIRITGAEIF